MNCSKCQHSVSNTARFCERCGTPVGPSNVLPDTIRTEYIEPPDPLIGQTLKSKYRILSRIGKGAMGIVYSARHEQLRHDVADQSSVKRFNVEATAAASIKH